MIDAKLLQSFMSDIEWMRATSNSSANASSSSKGAKSALFDPFEDILAKAMRVLQSEQSQEDMSLDGILSPGNQLNNMDLLNSWFSQGSSKNGSLTQSDIDSLFPDLANLNAMLGSNLY
jgi:hypothetical protein